MLSPDDSSSYPVPPAPFPDDFRAAVTEQLTAAGFTVIDWETTGVNVRPATGGEAQYIGLANLHRRAKAAAPAEWPAMVRAFLEHRAELLKAPAIPDDLSTITDRLRPRLGRPCDRTDKTPPWGIPLPGTGLEINLVVDCPHGMVYVTGPMLARSRKKGEDLLDVALENLRSRDAGRLLRARLRRVGHLHRARGRRVRRGAALFDRRTDAGRAGGVLGGGSESRGVGRVAGVVPGAGRVHVLKMFADENFREHAYPVSDDVFWVWHGTWYRFGIALEGEELVIDAPDPFGEALRELQGEG